MKLDNARYTYVSLIVLFRARSMTRERTRVIDTESIVQSGTRVGGHFLDLAVSDSRPYRETGKRNAAFHSNTMITVNSSSTNKTILVADRGKELANFRVVTANEAHFHDGGLLVFINPLSSINCNRKRTIDYLICHCSHVNTSLSH